MANQALIRPAMLSGDDEALAVQALGFICDLDMPGLRTLCECRQADTSKALMVPAQIVFDDAMIPWESVLFYRHSRAVRFVESVLNRYTAFAML